MKAETLIELFGSRAEAATALGVTQQAVHNWIVRGRVPKMRLFQVAAVTGIDINNLVEKKGGKRESGGQKTAVEPAAG